MDSRASRVGRQPPAGWSATQAAPQPSATVAETPAPPRIRVGSAVYWRANLALFAGGFVTFAALYCPQPLLPTFAAEFQVPPATASLAISVTTATLALSLVLAATLSEVVGRKPLMVASLLATSLLTLAIAWSPDFLTLLVLRAVQGVTLAGLATVAMGYLGEEIEPEGLGLAMGIFISGNSIGGMTGRIVTGLITDAFSWRVALASIGVLSLLCSLGFWLSLPPSAHFRPRPFAGPRALFAPLARHLRDAGLRRLYGVGFLIMGAFVSLYNYIAFDLEAPPYGLSPAAVSWIFLLYLVGTFSSTLVGRLADRLGRSRMLWVAVVITAAGAGLTLGVSLPAKVLGVAVFTFGYFGAHSVASGWVAQRAQGQRAQAASLYLLLFYLGASVGGSLGGYFWVGLDWPGVVTLITVLLALALLLAVQLVRIPPVRQDGGPP